jgi:hypothetical protein
MPKSKRAKVIHTTKVDKKTREHKDRLFKNIRDCVPEYQHCFVFSVDNMRNSYLKDVRHELSDCRYVCFLVIILPAIPMSVCHAPTCAAKLSLAAPNATGARE